MKRFFCHAGKEKTGALPNFASRLKRNVIAYLTLIFKGLHRILLRLFARGTFLPLCKNKSFSVRKKLETQRGIWYDGRK
ncbi:hypothetical protein [Hominenteromicrobium sp.]|uniref:hypothetical protein n=1 Tax=Hominenteromicrobium sp. TaxID=3073581 RepID=UPI003AB40D92